MDEKIIDRIFEKAKTKRSLKKWMEAYLQELNKSDEDTKVAIDAMKYANSMLEV